MARLSCSSVVVALVIASCFAQEPPPPSIIARLPDTFAPISYVLRLEPNMTTKSVNGAVIITLNATFPQNETVDAITLHLGPDSTVNESAIVVLDLTSGLKKNTSAVEYDDDNTLIRVLFGEDRGLVGSHVYLISLQFTSVIYSQPQGLFYGSFNETSWYVAASLRPTFARHVLPCFDEPHLRAPITLQVLRPADYAAYSTAALATSDSMSGGQVLDTFQPTGAIPVHGLGLFLTQVTPAEDSNLMLFAPPATPLPSALPYLSGLLGNLTATLGPAPVAAPIKLVVLPDRFKDTFSSIGFVYTTPMEYTSLGWPLGPGPRLSLPEEVIRQYLEFPHSPVWWSHLWLSESIGTFLALNLHPEQWVRDWMKIEARSVGADFAAGPVVNAKVETRWDIRRALSSQVIKMKGLSILLMWNDTLPEGVVKKTIVSFIKNSGGVVTSDDFLTLLGQNVAAESSTYNATDLIPLLPAWLYSSAVPVVSYWPQPMNDSLVISQVPYPLDNNTSVFGLSVSYAQNASRDWHNFRRGLWLADNVTNLTTPLTAGQWTLLNLEAAPYRVEYKDGTRRWLTTALSSDLAYDAPQSVTAAIQDDVVSMALAGSGYFTDLFLVLNSTKRTTFDWIPVMKAFKGLDNLIGPDTYIRSIFKSFAATLFPADTLASLDLRNSTLRPDQLFVRALAAPWLCALDIGSCRAASVELIQELLQENWSRMHWSVRGVVACSGVRYNASAFDPLLAAYEGATEPGLRSLYATGLGCVTDPAVVARTLSLIGNFSTPQQSRVGGRKVRSIADSAPPMSAADLQTFLVSLAGQQDNVPAIVQFMLNNSANLTSSDRLWHLHLCMFWLIWNHIGLKIPESVKGDPESLQQLRITFDRFSVGPHVISAVIDVLGQFRSTDVMKLSALQSQIGLDAQVAQSIAQSVSQASANVDWWKSNNASFEADLAVNQNVTMTTAAPATASVTTASPATGGSTASTPSPGTPTPKPSSATASAWACSKPLLF